MKSITQNYSVIRPVIFMLFIVQKSCTITDVVAEQNTECDAGEWVSDLSFQQVLNSATQLLCHFIWF